ncbi:signal recognition particle receptor subunit alpha, partial [Halobacillus sp. BBL2006]|uniref:signal recognition particle receptor subunit alpha n=1 Tax=Halobacillus sp. BBL2006 TaxID=1543706 RepID=UPI000541C6EF
MSFFKKLKEKFVKDIEGNEENKEEKELMDEEESSEEQAPDEQEVQEESSFDETFLEGETEFPPQDQDEDLYEEPEQEESFAEETEEPPEEEEEEVDSIASKFKRGLAKTRNSFSSKINDLVARYRTVDEDFFEELEEVLISADVGVNTVMEMIDELEMEVKRRNIKDTRQVKEVISEKLVEIYYGDDQAGDVEGLNENPDGLTIYLFVGVNGVGKTTTIGKLAHRLKAEGKKVTLAAGDTFRAGAIDQLEAWGDRVGV